MSENIRKLLESGKSREIARNVKENPEKIDDVIRALKDHNKIIREHAAAALGIIVINKL